MPTSITFHGVRGSIPAPGPSTARYGGNTSCVEVQLSDGSLLVLDAGTGLRTLGDRLLARKHSGPIHLLLSHTHWDHVIGLPFFTPIFLPQTHLLVYPLANDAQERFRRDMTVFDEIHFPVRFEQLMSKIEVVPKLDGPWEIGSAKIRRITLNHPGGAQGYRIDDANGASIAYLTDNELHPPSGKVVTTDQLADFASGVDLMIHDSQYLPPDFPLKHGWGHSQVDDVLQLAHLADASTLALFHHDPMRSDDAVDQIQDNAREWLGNKGSRTAALAAYEGLTIDLK
jgi:phosphoribosyl 1,2-cyclic phosphodiesterase